MQGGSLNKACRSLGPPLALLCPTPRSSTRLPVRAAPRHPERQPGLCSSSRGECRSSPRRRAGQGPARAHGSPQAPVATSTSGSNAGDPPAKGDPLSPGSQRLLGRGPAHGGGRRRGSERPRAPVAEEPSPSSALSPPRPPEGWALSWRLCERERAQESKSSLGSASLGAAHRWKALGHHSPGELPSAPVPPGLRGGSPLRWGRARVQAKASLTGAARPATGATAAGRAPASPPQGHHDVNLKRKG